MGAFSLASGLAFTSVGLSHYKHRLGCTPHIPVFEANRGLKSLEASWLRSVADRILPSSYDNMRAAQAWCSGIDLVIQTLDNLTQVQAQESTASFIERCRKQAANLAAIFPLVKQIDWDAMDTDKLSPEEAANFIRQAILKQVIENAEFMDVFLNHLSRVPRDIDGKLLPNMDAGCSPPEFILGDVAKSIPLIAPSTQSAAVQELTDRGLVIVKNAVNLDAVEEARAKLRLRSSYSVNGSRRFETRETLPEEMFKDDRSVDVSYTQLASGRFAYELRCSKLESAVKPLHSSVMPVVWDYLAKQRDDSLLNCLLGQCKSANRSIPRVFMSSIALVCSDPLSGSDSWHATNGGSGVVVLVPLTPYEDKNGNTLVLPGSHKSWNGLGGIAHGAETVLRSGGVMEIKADCGDAVIMDARLMRMTLRNELFNRSRVWLAFHYDFTDRPAPHQWLPRTLFMNALAAVYVRMDRLYRKLPPLSPPKKVE